jgi:P27 family predicted phage terminase small subunit
MKCKSQFSLLSDESKALYRRLVKEWRITDGAGAITLLTTCQCLDRMRAAQSTIAAEGIVARDRFGQLKPHPACQIEKEARGGLLQGLRALNLDLETLEMGDVE